MQDRRAAVNVAACDVVYMYAEKFSETFKPFAIYYLKKSIGHLKTGDSSALAAADKVASYIVENYEDTSYIWISIFFLFLFLFLFFF